MWCRIDTNDCASAIRRLGRETRRGNSKENEENWPLLPPPHQKEVIGETRSRLSEQLAAILDARVAGAPVPCLWGERKVGKRVVAAEAAARANLTVRAELPLRRIVWDSVLQYGLEKVMETLDGLAFHLETDDVLLISDAHLLSMIKPMSSSAVCDEIVLQTIADLPFPTVLIATRDVFRSSAQVLNLQTPGLEGPSEVLAFLDSAYHGQICLQRDAVEILMRAAAVEGEEGNPIAPGRISYLVDLARALALRTTTSGGESEEPVLVPDDVVAATSLVGPVWARSQMPCDGEEE
jgi:hypothetical protein